MRKKFVASFAVFSAMAFAGAPNTYKVDLYQTTVVNGTTFKPGECKVEVKDNQIVLKQGKNTAEASAKIETGANKFSNTSVGYTDGSHIQEIRLGGTNTKIVFDPSSNTGTATGR